MEETIKVGQYVVIQRREFSKLLKFNNLETTVVMGRDTIEIKNIENANWFTTFKMQLKESGKKRIYSLETCDSTTDWKEVLKSIDSGTDNRNIHDDGQSQTLTNQEILSMREKAGGAEIIETLVANSKSFNEKTEFSQEKYIKKKEKKYFDFIQVRKPTIRLLAEIFYRQDPEKPLGLRIDSLSQLISYSNVNSSGTFLVYEAGTSGLVPAAFLNSMGAAGDARLVHIHPGNFAQKQAVAALNLSEDHTKKCVSVNLYSVLRQFYQNSGENGEVAGSLEKIDEKSVKNDENSVKNDEKSVKNDENSENSYKNLEKIDEKPENPLENGDSRKRKADDSAENESAAKKPSLQDPATKDPQKKPKWFFENEEAIELLKKKVDSLVIVSKEDPFNIAKELLQFVHPGRPVVIFHTCKEILMECYSSLKSLDKIVNLRLTTNWMRNYQVLPMRTHPAVQITGTSGNLLVGYTINSK